MQLVTFGEALLRLTPSAGQRLDEAAAFDAYVGGTELNVAVAAARLGITTRFVTRLPDNPVGRRVAQTASDAGVDVDCVTWAEGERLGLYFVELAADAGASASNVVYDRADSAMARVQPGMIDWDRALAGAKWFHVGGITPALSDTAAATLLEGMQAARSRAIPVSYDVNYRPALWSAGRAMRVQEPLLTLVDVLIASERAASAVFAAEGDGPEAIARALKQRCDVPVVAITGRKPSSTRAIVWRGAIAADTIHSVKMSAEVTEPIGGGDAFAAGLIHGRLCDQPWDVALRHGAALVKLKYATPGDFSRATAADLEQALSLVFA